MIAISAVYACRFLSPRDKYIIRKHGVSRETGSIATPSCTLHRYLVKLGCIYGFRVMRLERQTDRQTLSSQCSAAHSGLGHDPCIPAFSGSSLLELLLPGRSTWRVSSEPATSTNCLPRRPLSADAFPARMITTSSPRK